MFSNSKLILTSFFFLLSFDIISKDSFIKIFDALNGNEWESPYCTKVIAPNKIVTAGTLRTLDWTGEEGFLMELDSSFNRVWAKKYNTSNNTRIFSFEHTRDNGFLLIGSINTNILNPYGVLVVKTDSLGIVQWSKIYEGFDATASCLARNGDCLITGQSIRVTPFSGNSVINLIRINGNGDMLLNYTYGVTPASSYIASGSCIKEALDGGIILTGLTQGPNLNSHATFLLKTDKDGIVEWSKTYDGNPVSGVLNNADTGEDIFLEADSGFVIGGNGTNWWSNAGTVMFKTDKNGNFLWGKHTNPCRIYAHGQKICRLNNGYAILAWDHINNKVYLAATNSVGGILWQKYFGSVVAGDWFAASLWQSSSSEISFVTSRSVNDHNIYIARTSTQADSCSIWFSNVCDSIYNPIVANIFLLREELDQEAFIQTTESILIFMEDNLCDGITMSASEQEKNFGVKLFPVPATKTLNVHIEDSPVEITVMDINGKILLNRYVFEKNFSIPLINFQSGIYFMKIQAKGLQPVMKKFLVVGEL